jgi:hypothetical protein
MALGDDILNGAANGAAAQVAFGAIHSSDSAASQTSNQRLAVIFDPATGHVAAASNVPLLFTGTAGAAATHFGIWSAVSGGTHRGSVLLVGDQTFNAAGEYQVDTITMTGTDET